MSLARYIDHTLLRPEATEAEVRQLLAEAAEHGFASVCIPPVHVALAAEVLDGTPVAVGTVVGFPLGYVHPEVRRAESRQAVADGAGELDTVLNLSWLKSGEDRRVLGRPRRLGRSDAAGARRADPQGDPRDRPADRRGEGPRRPAGGRSPAPTS